ncbi:MAG TPA: hypothetical protein QGF02_00130 [Candidatus Babeliales bacterium]|nr:hypothetical protein [Candidatus Babeliales bacterium]
MKKYLLLLTLVCCGSTYGRPFKTTSNWTTLREKGVTKQRYEDLEELPMIEEVLVEEEQ